MSPQRPVKYPDLGEELRRARVRTTSNQSEFARLLGWQQSKVWRLEDGRIKPSEDDVRAWAAAAGVDEGELLDARERALTRHLDIREAARTPGGVEALQDDLARLEAGSRTLVEYQPTVIPAMSQTPEYTREWLTAPGRPELGGVLDVDAIVERRSRRQREARQRGAALTVAVEPGALTGVYGSTDVHRAQLDALAEQAATGDVELLVARRPLPILHGFELLDDAVTVETVAGVRVMSDPEVHGQFVALLDRVREGGHSGAAALRAVREAHDRLEPASVSGPPFAPDLVDAPRHPEEPS
ncbi:Scr1 family TA system antitoxin-like transcriptional regulator [Actinomycetospora flava]|uniref:Scr1 family TA system antitoxin-like transcriptional regulator n=1 Tax=Actinomycetospora flava TaxID=3129232 RepID=A0ABU8LZK0_9PSEU